LRTHSHAWSAYPAEFFLRKLIGLEILEPGCRKIRVQPKETDFNYKVQVPLPQGLIKVEKVDENINISVPENVILN